MTQPLPQEMIHPSSNTISQTRSRESWEVEARCYVRFRFHYRPVAMK
jgi:hypothetical protein